MKQFYGQMTREELKGAVYSGEHLKEFAQMCEAAGVNRWNNGRSDVESDTVAMTTQGTYCFCSVGLQQNIKWQPEPDQDLLKIVNLCGGVWPERADADKVHKDIFVKCTRGPVRCTVVKSLCLKNLKQKERKEYTNDQFEAAKVYVDTLKQGVVAENLERILKDEKEWCIKFGAYARDKIKGFDGNIFRIWYEKFCAIPANIKPLNDFIDVAKEVLNSDLNAKELVTISTKDGIDIYNIVSGEKISTEATTVYEYLQEANKEISPLDIAVGIMGVCFDTFKVKEKENKNMPIIKRGSWINIQGLTEKQALYCVDWLAERTGKESWIGGVCEHDKVAAYYKDCDIIQSHLDSDKSLDKNLEIKAVDILPDAKPAFDIDQSVYTFRGDELTVYRVENGKHLLSDLKWYSLEDLTGCKQTSIVQRIIKDHVNELNDGIEIQDKGNRDMFNLAKKIVESLK